MNEQLRKAAILLIALGPKVAGPVIKRLPEETIEKLTRAIAGVGRVPSEERTRVIAEFAGLRRKTGDADYGGECCARAMIEEALGRHKAGALLSRATGYSGIQSFESLKQIDPATVAGYLKNEHVQTAAVVLAHMDPRYSGPVLALLPAPMQGEVAYRVATLERPDREALEIVENIIARQVQGEFAQARRRFGGKRQVAEILNEVEKEVWQEVLEEIREIDIDCANEVKSLMFMFEDLVNLDDRAIREILKEIDSKELTLALKGATAEIKHKIFHNMSKRAVLGIEEDMEFMGPVRLQDVQDAQARIVDVVRNLEEAGAIMLGKGSKGAELVA